MGDVSGSSHEDRKTLEALREEIHELQIKYQALKAERRQWEQRRRLLRESITKFHVYEGSTHSNSSRNGSSSFRSSPDMKSPQAMHWGRDNHIRNSVQDQMQGLLHAACYRQAEALDDFRSALAHRQCFHDTSRLARESKALHDAFHIGYQGPFATINGLRLGAEAILEDYQPADESPGGHRGTGGTNGSHNASTAPLTVKVPWSEINSALGLLALLLSCLEQKPHAGIRYRHEIYCIGSTSKIGVGRREDRGSTTCYNLYSDDSFQFFGRRNFNNALQCLVQCVADAAEAIQRRDPTIHLPHPIDRSTRDFTIGGLPVAYGSDGVEWTRAMKYLLTDVKHLTCYRAFGLWDVTLEN